MTVYVLAQLAFTDRAAYDRYQRKFFDVFKRFNGRLLVADDHPTVMEGKWERNKVVLMSFPDEAEAQRFSRDAEYLEISKDRKAGADTLALLLQGFAPGR